MTRLSNASLLTAAVLLLAGLGGSVQAEPILQAAASEPDGAAREAVWVRAIALQEADRPSEALALLSALLPLEQRDHPGGAGTLRIQARLMSVLVELPDMAAALPLAEAGYAEALATLGPEDRTTRDFRTGLTRLLAFAGRYDEAEPMLRQDMEAELAAGDMEAARSTGYILARVYTGLHREADADAVRLRITEGDIDDPEVLEYRIDLLMEVGDKPAAEPLARRLVAMRQGVGRPVDLKMARVRLARSLFHSTEDTADDPRIVEAETIYRRLYAEERENGPAIAPVVTAELGELLIKTADPDTPRQDEGLRLNEEALDLLDAALGPDHPETLAWLSQLAVYQFGLMRFDSAAASMERFHRARDAGAAVTFAAAANALTIDAGLALQEDNVIAAHRILTRESRRIHDDLVSASHRDDARTLQAQIAYVDRLSVAVAWRAAAAMTSESSGPGGGAATTDQ